jgi:hypothetical protein
MCEFLIFIIVIENSLIGRQVCLLYHIQGASVNRAIWQQCFFPGLVGVGRMPLLPPSGLLQSVLVAMEPWTGAQSVFAVKAFYKNGDIHRNRAVPSAHAIKT